MAQPLSYKKFGWGSLTFGGWLVGHSVMNGMKFKLNLKGRNRAIKQTNKTKGTTYEGGDTLGRT